MTMAFVIAITLIVLLLVNSEEDMDTRGRFIANAITLADMGLLAWLIC